jgi:hypothetical protein
MSSSSSSSPKKHVYVAIPIDVMLREHLPLTADSSSSSSSRQQDGVADDSPVEHQRQPSPSRPFAYFAVGAVLGILFSVVGFYLQETFRFANIFWYSLAWSCLTSVASYALFYGWTVFCDGSRRRQSHPGSNAAATTSASVKLEYHFALGVFLGFCLACIVTDVFLQMPLKSILMTIAIAVAWAGVMAYCGSLEGDDDDEPCDADNNGHVLARPTAAIFRGERKGTVLPLVIV